MKFKNKTKQKKSGILSVATLLSGVTLGAMISPMEVSATDLAPTEPIERVGPRGGVISGGVEHLPSVFQEHHDREQIMRNFADTETDWGIPAFTHDVYIAKGDVQYLDNVTSNESFGRFSLFRSAGTTRAGTTTLYGYWPYVSININWNNGHHSGVHSAKGSTPGGTSANDLIDVSTMSAVWCIEPLVPFQGGPNPGYTAQNDGSHWLKEASLAAYYGFEANKKAGKVNNKDNTLYTLATEIWIQERAEREKGTGVKLKSLTASGPDIPASAQFSSGWLTYDYLRKIHKEIDEEVRKFNSPPKLTGTGVSGNVIETSDPITLTDSNKSIGRYQVANIKGDMDVKISGNSLTITPKSAVQEDWGFDLVYALPDEIAGKVAQRYVHPSPGQQNTMRAGITAGAKVSYRLKPATRDVTITKTDNHGNKVPDATFEVTHEGGTDTVTTNAKGVVVAKVRQGDVSIVETDVPAGHKVNPTPKELKNVTEDTAYEHLNYKQEIPESDATGEFGKAPILPEKEVTIQDEVDFKYLYTDREYRLDAEIFDVDTGKTTEITSSKTFTPETEHGKVSLDIDFNADLYRGRNLVVTQKLYEVGRNALVDTHHELDSTTQEVPEIYDSSIKTKAWATEDGLKEVDPLSTTSLTDTVSYKYIKTGLKYRMRAQLIHKKTGDVLAENQVEFTPTEENGTVDVPLVYDATKVRGDEVVVFETLERYREGSGKWMEIAVHEDKNDAEQTVYTTNPNIGTTATSIHDGGKLVHPLTKDKVIDTVAFDDLIVGHEYTMKGYFVVKPQAEETEEDSNGPRDENGYEYVTLDGEPVVVEKTFTAETKKGSVELEFDLDLSDLRDKEIVAFEELSYKGEIIAEHKDIEDENQTVRVVDPQLQTLAWNLSDNSTLFHPIKEQTIVDQVEYKDVIPGLPYTMRGYPIVKDGESVDWENFPELRTLEVETEKPVEEPAAEENEEETPTAPKEEEEQPKKEGDVLEGTRFDKSIYAPELPEIEKLPEGYDFLRDKEGQPIVVEHTFIPEQSEGVFELEFQADLSALRDKEIVMYEELFFTHEIVGEHREPNEEKQKVYTNDPLIGTMALWASQLKEENPTGKHTTYDTVKYENLVEGYEYTMKGILMDKETGKPLLVNGETVESELIFTAGQDATPVDKHISVDDIYEGDTMIKGRSKPGYRMVATIGEDLATYELTVGETGFFQIEVDETLMVADTNITLEVYNDEEELVETVEQPKVEETQPAEEENGETPEEGVENEEAEPTPKPLTTIILTVKGREETTEAPETEDEEETPVEGEGSEVEAPSEETDGEQPSDDPRLWNHKKLVSGEVELPFDLDITELRGKDIVVYEVLYHEGQEIARHEDLEDEDQTVRVTNPMVATLAANKRDGTNIISPKPNQVIVDKVSFEDLIPGREYRLEGFIMDKETGERLLIKGKPVYAETTFTPETKTGVHELEFTLDATELDGKDLVVFEKLYEEGVEIAAHEDLNDENQTILVRSKPKADEKKQKMLATGTTAIGGTALLLSLLAGAGFVVGKKRKM